MKIILDTNVLISALLNPNGVVGTFLLQNLRGHDKLSCYMLYVELFDKKEKIKKYTKLSEVELLELLYLLIKQIDFINESQISQNSWKQAEYLTKDIDVKDVSFVALTVETNGILWTGDKKLIKGLRSKNFNRIYSLDELKKIIQNPFS